MSKENLISLTADIVAAHVENNNVAVSDLPLLIANVHAALAGLGTEPLPVVAEQQPAVPIRSSIKPDHIFCLEDGKKMKMLKRHLSTDHGMTPAQYREKWKLAADYPMVAPSYAAQRKDLAIKIGLGRNKPEAKPEPKPATRRRAK
ncbi:MAG: MucR family transcriptional regulator [Sphingobium sp.]